LANISLNIHRAFTNTSSDGRQPKASVVITINLSGIQFGPVFDLRAFGCLLDILGDFRGKCTDGESFLKPPGEALEKY
jgi:hypothetical protein